MIQSNVAARAAVSPPVIREMAPGDASRVADVHLAAFPGFFLSFLGRRFLRLLYSQAIALGEIVLVAEADGQVIGLVMGSSRPGRFFRQLIRRRLFAFAFAALPAVARQPSTALRVLRALKKPGSAEKPEGTATLMSIAVDPATQSVGAGRALVRAFVEEARRRGSTKVDLTTDNADNDRVNRFYSSLGFRVAREIVTPENRVLNEYELDIDLPRW